MRRIAFLLCFAHAVCLGQTLATGSITGRVYNSMTGETVSGASVRALQTAGPGQQDAPSATSQDDGSFHIDSLAPGEYILVVEKEGFVPDPAKRGLGIANVQAAQTAGGVQLALVPDGGIAGTVTDENDAPLAGVTVEGMVLGGVGAPLRLHAVGQAATTDKAGHYALATLTPGNYFVAAIPDNNSTKPSAEGYARVTTFFPAAPSAADASPVLVNAGESSTANVKLRLALVHRITGQLAGLPDSISMKRARLVLTPREAGRVPALQRYGAIASDHTFTIANVPSGGYILTLSMGDDRRGRSLSRQEIEVGSDDVSGVVVRLMEPVTLTGTISEDAPNPGPLGPINIRAVQVEGGRSVVAAPLENGTFKLAGLEPARYVVVVRPGGQGLYVSSLTLDQRDILNQVVDLSQAAGGQIMVVLRPGAGEIAGTVDKPSSMVVLAPEQVSPDGANVHIGYAQPNGSFDFRNVPPGNYFLYAANASSANVSVWIQPVFLHAIESLGTPVHLDENGKQQAEVRVTEETVLRGEAQRLGLNFQ